MLECTQSYKMVKVYIFFAILSVLTIGNVAAQSNLPVGIIGNNSNIQNQVGSSGGVSGGLGIGIGGAGIGGLNGGLNALGSTVIKGSDPLLLSNTKVPIPVFSTLTPNDFQKYILQVTGQMLPIFGYNFFENIRLFETDPNFLERDNSPVTTSLLNSTQFNSPFSPQLSSPISKDYILGSGDQLLIRAWGSIDVNYQATIDRAGIINIPKIGPISVAGIRFSQVETIINNAISKIYKNYELNVSMGQTRTITIFVVGQARRPGSYNLSSLSTVSSALFASGGPNNNGSMRRVQVKRSNTIIAELDLYTFLSQGKIESDIKLIDGDVLVIPPSYGYVALVGKLNTPAIFELKNDSETVGDMIAQAGGLSIITNPMSATLERLDTSQIQPRTIFNINLGEGGLKTLLKKGDLISFYSVAPEINNGVTLRGNVTQARRMPWKEGLRVKDLIPSRETLISLESIRLQNEVLFDDNQRERTQREREQIPIDLLLDPNLQVLAGRQNSNKSSAMASSADHSKQEVNTLSKNNSFSGIQSRNDGNEINIITLEKWQQQRENRLISHQNKIDNFKPESLADRVGKLMDQVNFDYAVIERVDRRTLNVLLIPFDLGQAIDNPNSVDNLQLESGDVVTIFSQNDIRVPISKKRIMVRIEGEVKNPGIYQASPKDNLSSLLKKAGGLTSDAYLFGSTFTREEVKKAQIDNLYKLLSRLESESSANLSQISQSAGASSDAGVLQTRVLAAQQTQKLAIERIKNIRPEGRIALGITPGNEYNLNEIPQIHLENNDRLFVPSKPDFVYIYGSVNTESALLFKKGWTVEEYLRYAGVGSGADQNAVILIRADGTAKTSNGTWSNQVNISEVMPGDSIIVPEKLDRESVWSSIFRNSRDVTQIFYQLGLGAAAIKTLRN